MTIGETLDKDLLQRQLQEARREAEEFKQQLALKEREAENYKQKLDEINSGEKVIKKSPRKQTLETRNHDKSWEDVEYIWRNLLINREWKINSEGIYENLKMEVFKKSKKNKAELSTNQCCACEVKS